MVPVTMGMVPAAQALGQQHLDRLAEQLGAAPTEQDLGLGVGQADPAIGVGDDQGVGGGLDDGMELVLAVTRRSAAVGLIAAGDRQGRMIHCGQCAGGVQGVKRRCAALVLPACDPRRQCSAVGNPGMLTAEQFVRVCRLADRLAGIELQDRHHQLLGRRLRRDGVDVDRLLDGAERGGAEAVGRLISLLTTNHTAFFRHPHQFDLVAEHALWAAHKRGSARIWSAAVATGEEAWSLALLVLSVFGSGRPPVSILATDIDAGALAVAEAGVYPAASLAAIPAAYRDGIAGGCVGARARDLVRFGKLNLIDCDWQVGGPLDAVLCRNVLMYLRADHRYAILERIAALLAPDGLLLLDPSEHLGPAALFFTDGRDGVYGLRRRTGPQRRANRGRP